MKTLRSAVQKLHNEEWHRLHSEYKGKVLHYNPAAIGSNFSQLFGRYLSSLLKADKALKIPVKSAYTH